MVLNRQGTFLHGEDVSGPLDSCFLSLPQIGKHFCCEWAKGGAETIASCWLTRA